MKTERITLTPEIAKEWLDRNAMNRTISESWVEFLASEMTVGHWKENGDTFRFDCDGQMLDGQHRCLAFIKAEFSFEVTVVTELDRESRLTVDANRRRKFADDLAMNGIAHSDKIEPLMRRIVRWIADFGFANRDYISRSTLADEYPHHADEVADAIEHAAYYSKMPISFGVRAFVWWMLRRNAPEDMVKRFFSILTIGSQDINDRVVVGLRAKIDAQYHQSGRRIGSNEYVYYMIRGWNAWLTGDRTRYALPRGGLTNPYPIPLPVQDER